MTVKISSLKEKIRQALDSTKRVISEDFSIINEKKISPKDNRSEMMKVENLSSPEDFIRLRAEFDTSALEKKFSNK